MRRQGTARQTHNQHSRPTRDAHKCAHTRAHTRALCTVNTVMHASTNATVTHENNAAVRTFS